MKLQFTSVVLAAALTAGIAQAECQPKHEFATVTPGELTVAVVTYMPYGAIGPDNLPMGVDGEILKEIAKRNCLGVKAIAVDAGGAVNYVVTGRADVTMGDFYRTEARAKVANITDPLYVDQMGIITKDGTSKFDDLIGKNVGAVQGDLWVGDLKTIYGSKYRNYPALAALIQDLDVGRLDGIFISYSVFSVAQKNGQLLNYKAAVADKDPRVEAALVPSQSGFVVSKSNDTILDGMNKHIKDLHDEGFIRQVLTDAGLDPSAADTGEPRLMK